LMISSFRLIGRAVWLLVLFIAAAFFLPGAI